MQIKYSLFPWSEVIAIFSLISGEVGGNCCTHKGCDVRKRDHQSHDKSQVYGTEYQTDSSYQLPAKFTTFREKEVPCAVCYRKGKSSVIIIPGKLQFNVFRYIYIFLSHINDRWCLNYIDQEFVFLNLWHTNLSIHF